MYLFRLLYAVNGQFETSDPELINDEQDSSSLMRSLRSLMMSSAPDADLPERLGTYGRWRNLQKKSKEKHRLLFTRMGRAAGADVDTPPALVQYLRNFQAKSRFPH